MVTWDNLWICCRHALSMSLSMVWTAAGAAASNPSHQGAAQRKLSTNIDSAAESHVGRREQGARLIYRTPNLWGRVRGRVEEREEEREGGEKRRRGEGSLHMVWCCTALETFCLMLAVIKACHFICWIQFSHISVSMWVGVGGWWKFFKKWVYVTVFACVWMRLQNVIVSPL